MGTSFENEFSLNWDRYLAELTAYLGYKSVSTDSKRQEDCFQCASWLLQHLEGIGFKSELLKTETNPVVYAHREGAKGSKRVLIYGHYDVVDPGPDTDWTTNPFAPSIRDGRLYARGATDNKGPTFFLIKGIESLIKQGCLNASVTLLIEGEEERGSSVTVESLPQWKDKLQADVLLVCDSGAVQEGHPAITMGLRNNFQAEIKVSGLFNNLHSGFHGGIIKNPATELCRMLAALHNKDGSVAIPGFYDNIQELSETERDLVNRHGPSAEEYQKLTGAPPNGGESQYSPFERRGFRPCLDISGISAGYTGPGVMNIIPAFAEARLTARIVPNQDQDRLIDTLEKFLKKISPEGLKVDLVTHRSAGQAFRLNPSSPNVSITREALHRVSGKDPMLLWEGGSIPIVSVLSELTGAEPILLGFILSSDNMHGANESFPLEHAKLIYLASCEILGNL